VLGLWYIDMIMAAKIACFVGTENEAKLVEESIQHGREAITLDVKDGNSWCKDKALQMWHICDMLNHHLS